MTYRPIGNAIAERERLLNPVLSRSAMSGLVDLTRRRLKTQCDITREFSTRSNAGGLSASVKVVTTTYCDVERLAQRITKGESQLGDAPTDIFFYCVLPRGVDVRNSDRIYVPGLLTKWQPVTAYAVGAVIVPNSEFGDGHCYACAQAGTSGTVQPPRSQQAGARHTDGNVIWQEVGRAFVLEVIGSDDKKSGQSAVIYQCSEIR